MEKVVRFVLNISTLFIIILLTGCAQPARELPPDMSNLSPSQRLLPGDENTPEYKMPCSDLKMEFFKTREAIINTEKELHSIQEDNQTKGAVAVILFTPLVMTMENNQPLKDRYQQLDLYRERIQRIAQARQCVM